MNFTELAAREKARRAAISSPDRCELDDDVDAAAPVIVHAPAVNTNTKAYQAGYAAGATAALEEGAEAALSAQAAGKADEALRNAVGFNQMARILGVKKSLDDGTPRRTTPEFQVACDDYSAGYATGWDAGEVAALERLAAF